MSMLEWADTGEKLYETGVEKVVLFPQMAGGVYGAGVAWSGVTNVSEKPTGAEATAIYADNGKYLNLISNEDLEGSIEAYMYPNEWKECDGSAEIAPGVYISQQSRKGFGLCFRSKIGNDTDGVDHGYKLHIIYGANAAPTEMAYNTINESVEPSAMSWEFKTTPVNVDGCKPTARIVIESTKADSAKLKDLESILYGSDDKESRLPLPDEIASLMATTTGGDGAEG